MMSLTMRATVENIDWSHVMNTNTIVGSQNYVISPRILCLRNKFLLTGFVAQYHWLEVSHEVDISRAQSASDIFTDD